MCRGKKQRKLEQYIELKKKWIERFSGDHRNSICQQLCDLSWYLTVFHVLNESRPFSKDTNGKYHNNSMLHNFIDKCFFEYLHIALRRLLDRDSSQSTCSLYRIIADMENNYHLMTRQVFFDAYGIEYDVEKTRKEYDEYCQAQEPNITYTVPHRLCWEILEHRHTVFDKLSATDKNKRRPNDLIRKAIFEELRHKLDHFHDDVVQYTDDFIAHLARPLDTKKNSANEINLTLGRLCETHEILCKIATFIGRYFLEFPGPFLGVVTFDQFENIDRPFVETSNVGRLREIWDKYSKKIYSWSYVDINDYDNLVKHTGKTRDSHLGTVTY